MSFGAALLHWSGSKMQAPNKRAQGTRSGDLTFLPDEACTSTYRDYIVNFDSLTFSDMECYVACLDETSPSITSLSQVAMSLPLLNSPSKTLARKTAGCGQVRLTYGSCAANDDA